MEETSQEICFHIHEMENKTRKYECKIYGRFLSTKQRTLTHLYKKHNKSKYLLPNIKVVKVLHSKLKQKY